MSWDFCLEPSDESEPACPTCGHRPEPPVTREFRANYTYNVSPMFYRAFGNGGIRKLHMVKASNAAVLLADAIEKMKAEPDVYRAMNPENGWGSYEGALGLLMKLRRWCAEQPTWLLRVS